MPTTVTDPPAAPRRRYPRRRCDERGFSIALAALLLVPLMLMAGLAIDLGAWYLEASDIQEAADAASLAGVAALPQGNAAATARAREVATQNGFTHGVDDVEVYVDITGARVRVRIVDRKFDQYFTSVVREASKIERKSTAEYIQPIPMGSPRNYLGTGTLLPTNQRENFWLSVSGLCAPREKGDRITPLSRANYTNGTGSGWAGCVVGSPGHVKANPEFDANGYLFAVEVPTASGSAPVALQMLDAPYCGGGGSGRNFLGDPWHPSASALLPFDSRVTLYRGDANLPLDGTVLATRTFRGSMTSGGDCGNGIGNASPGECTNNNQLMECWHTVLTVSAPGTYYLQYQPLTSGTAVENSHNFFSLRAKRNGTFTACSSDPTSSAPAYDVRCPQVFATENLPIFANISSGNPSFFLASIDDRHNGRTMLVTLYDTAEGAEFIELLDPNGSPVVFEWEILCSDASRPSPGCPGEQEPAGGRGPGVTNKLDVSGNVSRSQRTDPQNVQSGKYSDRLIRLKIELPDDMAARYGLKTWWRIRYTTGPSVSDKTTWGIQLLGDPIRLVPNE